MDQRSANLARQSSHSTGFGHIYWLHYRTLEPFLQAELRSCSAPLLDLGCGNRPYSALYPQGEAIGVDVVQSSNRVVDVIVNDASSLPFPDGRFATVLCTQVLEHVPRPGEVLKEAFRLLLPRGRLVLTCPFVWELHEEPHDYLRFTPYWLQRTLKEIGFDESWSHPKAVTLRCWGRRLYSSWQGDDDFRAVSWACSIGSSMLWTAAIIVTISR
jgi:SAM-dependent methyltransferase